MEALRDHERSLEEEVLRRTRALTLTNEELRTEVELRRTLERQVQEISDRTMRRIGQDLHDDLCQHLAGVAMMATVVRKGLPEAAADAGPALDRIGTLLQDSVLRARHIAQGLYPPGLEERGLADALEELIVGLRDTSPAALVFETEGDCRGDSPDRRLQMFRIVQESVTNALRHSGSDVVRIHLARGTDGGLTATVTDFGTGLGPHRSRKGLGLSIMRYRADAAGLELKLETLNPGLRVVCRWPAEEEEHG
jgi:signal transduction histidine kinase